MILQTNQPMIENVVREAVAAGMGTPLRDAILEGVEEEEPMPVQRSRRAPMAVGLLLVCFALGYLLGRRAGGA